MPQIELSFQTAGIAAFLLFLISGAVAFLYYRRTLPPVSTLRRTTLALLRGCGLFFCTLLLLEPLVSIVHTHFLPPTVAVLVDNSQSMSLSDGGTLRSDLLHEEIEGISRLPLPSGGNLRYHLFGSKLHDGLDTIGDSLTLADEETNLSAALGALAEIKEQNNIQAVILLSDGSSNSGENPLYAAGRLRVPVFAVGIGDSSHPKDIGITRVSANQIVYEKTPTPVDVTLRSSGFPGTTVTLLLEDEGRRVDQQPVRLQDGVRDYTVRMNYEPGGEGVRRMSVRVGELEGELTGKNNRQDFFARVIKSRLRVLIISGGPSADLSAIRSTLAGENEFAVTTRTQRTSGGYYEGPLLQETLDSADCLMLVGFPTKGSESDEVRRIRNAIEGNRMPLFFIGGRQVSGPAFQELAPSLSFSPVTLSSAEEQVFLEPLQQNHPILAGGNGGGEGWRRLPPIFRTRSVFRSRAGAMILAHARIQDATLDEPLLVANSAGGRKTLSLLGYGIWRWKLLGARDPSTENIFSSFLSSAVRWLTTREQDRGLQVQTTREFYPQGDAVEFTGQLYDATARPIDDADIHLEVRSTGKTVELSLSPVSSGRYEGSLFGLDAGDYRFSATATRDGDTLGRSQSRFAIGSLNREFRDTRMDAELLRRISGATGGLFLGVNQHDRLEEALSSLQTFTPEEIVDRSNIELWNWLWSLAVILVCFTVEWLLRKMWGMI